MAKEVGSLNDVELAERSRLTLNLLKACGREAINNRALSFFISHSRYGNHYTWRPDDSSKLHISRSTVERF
jgi:hypothetical protein